MYMKCHKNRFKDKCDGCGKFDYLKGIDGCHIIFKNDSNAFILCSWLEDYDEYEEDIRELLSQLQDGLEVIIFSKNHKTHTKIVL